MDNLQKIARFIYLAQAGSDAGKGIYELPAPDFKSWRDGYAAKDRYILLAITAICREKSRDFRFSVNRGADQNGQPSFIVYFDFKVCGKREQVSFHSFNNELWKYVRKSRKSTWSKDRSSRDTVCDLSKSGVTKR